MQKVIFCLLFLFTFSVVKAGGFIHENSKQESNQKLSAIDLSDTVVFDLSQADSSLNQIKFPVYFLSDDTVNALDFSFKYNELEFAYDTILELVNYMQTFSYYNPFDSTLRFTSNSFQRYQNDTALLFIRFNILSGQFCFSDLQNVKAYLNGDVCSSKIVDCLHVDVEQLNKKKEQVEIYPNPASDVLQLWSAFESEYVIYNLDGSKVYQSRLKANQSQHIPTNFLNDGIYLVHIYSEVFSTTKKISIQH